MKKKLLVFGPIPQEHGGKQKNGLATGVFDLHQAISSVDKNLETYLASYDIGKPTTNIGNLTVIGWNYYVIFKYFLSNLYLLPSIFFKVFRIKQIASYQKIHHILFKLIFYNYSIYKIKPDIIQLHGCDDALISLFLPIKKNLIKALRLHGINGLDKNINNYSLYHEVEKYITKNGNFDFVSFVSTITFKTWENNYGSFKAIQKVILNGYNPLIFNVETKGSNNYKNSKIIKLITVGTISPRKGQKRVIEALLKLENFSEYEYTIIGHDFNNGRILKRLIKQKKLNVKFYEYMTQDMINKILSNSDYFILPSSSEGFGMVFIESIASGTPVIIPKHLPLAKEEGVLSKKNAMFLEDESVESIYNCLKNLKKYHFESKKVAETVNHLTWENIAIQYSKILNNLINNKL